MPEIFYFWFMLWTLLPLLQNLPPSAEDEWYLPIWVVPLLLGIVSFSILIKLLKLLEHGYAGIFDKPVYRNLFVYKKLPKADRAFLKKQFVFYNCLSRKDRRLLNHRMHEFISEVKFQGMEGLQLTREMELVTAAYAGLLCLGRKYHSYPLIEAVRVYPEEFYNEMQDRYFKGAFLPMWKTLAFSWKAVSEPQQGHRNLLIHELMHALQWESRLSQNFDAERFQKYFKKIVKKLQDKEVKARVDSGFFREYAFTNEFEFMAELGEYFFQSPMEFKNNLPELFVYMQKIFNIDIQSITNCDETV